MSAVETLRQAASDIRDDYAIRLNPFMFAVAYLLDGIADDFTDDEDYADNDFVSHALAVANAYLQETP